MTTASTPAIGEPVPSFTAQDQEGVERTLAEFSGRSVLLYFYPKAMTPGCTTQSCLMRDLAGEVGDAVIIGVSPDSPERQKKFDDKHDLGFTLLSDPEHEIAEIFGVWAEKKLYGKVYMGVVRSAFLIGPDGTLVAAFPKISPKDTPTKLLAALLETQS